MVSPSIALSALNTLIIKVKPIINVAIIYEIHSIRPDDIIFPAWSQTRTRI